jgi:hypothetical protein
VPHGVDEVVVDPSVLRPTDAPGKPIRVDGPGQIELSVAPEEPAPAPAGAPRRTLLWPLARRVAVEGRDRAQAIIAR